MSYRIVKIMDLSFSEIERIYATRPELASLGYEDQMKALHDNRYVYLNDFVRQMEALGNEAHDLVFNIHRLQRTWAEERGHRFQTSCWATDILLEQLAELKPEVVYLQGSAPLPRHVRRRLKQMIPSIRLVTMYLGLPEDVDLLGDVDLMFCGLPCIERLFREQGMDTELLYHCFDASIQIPTRETVHGFSYAGSSGYGLGSMHITRYWMLRELLEKAELIAWLKEHPDRDEAMSRFAYPPGFERMERLGDLFPERVRAPLFGMDMLELLADSRVSFNKHTDLVRGEAGNMRLFEATGVGTCLLTDAAENLSDLFEPDSEVVTYDCLEECIEKARWLLDHPEEARRIGRAGQRRTHRDHGLTQRLRQMDDAIRKRL